MLPAPNAWTPLPGRKKTKVVNTTKKKEFEKDIKQVGVKVDVDKNEVVAKMKLD